MKVTVITPTLPSRAPLLAEAVDSVAAQTVPCVQLVGVDHHHEGPAVVRNRLLRAVDTDWVAFLDDDDLLDPHHLERLLAFAEAENLDVAVPHCRFDGGSIPPKFCNQPYDRDRLRQHGIFPITVLARTEITAAVDGFPEGARYEDWEMWNAMADTGARFGVLPEATWTYRLGRADHRTHKGAA